MTPLRWRHKGRGFSLVEALITLLLVGMVLGVFAVVVRVMAQQGLGLDQKDQVVGGGLTALQRLGHDVKMAVVWVQPATTNGALVTALEFDIPDYDNDSLRKPSPTPNIAETPIWDPVEAIHLVRIRYRVEQGNLLREVRQGAVFEGIPLAGQVQGFSGQRSGRRELTIRLAINAGRQIDSLVQVISLPLPQAWGPP